MSVEKMPSAGEASGEPASQAEAADAQRPTEVATKRKRAGKSALRHALQSSLRTSGGHEDDVANRMILDVRPEDRAGYPVKRAPGSIDPRRWRTKNGDAIQVDFARFAWLPESWGQGLKVTKKCAHKRELQSTRTLTESWGQGAVTSKPSAPTAHNEGKHDEGTYTVLVAPDGKAFYTRVAAEKHWGRPFSTEDGLSGQVRLAELQAVQAVQLAKMEIKEAEERGAAGRPSGMSDAGADASFLETCLSPTERQGGLAKAEDFHFCVVSARRATKPEGIRDICMVQTQFLEVGVHPTWYVDEASLSDYEALGLKAKVGGKLTQARNMCLADANDLGKVCVQVSDDIAFWEYREGEKAKDKTDIACNIAWAAAKSFIVSPVAAARFILAKMRSAPEVQKPLLGGIFMLGSCARAMSGESFSRQHFIIGDFFVVDTGSEVRFDEKMKLKEDYDFTCAHIKASGSVMRCNRMTIRVKHYDNSGGAVAVRNEEEEQRNIEILRQKWPGVFYANPRRQNEVILRWPKKGPGADAAEDDADAEEELGGKPVSVTPAKKRQRRVPPVSEAKVLAPNAEAPKAEEAQSGIAPKRFKICEGELHQYFETLSKGDGTIDFEDIEKVEQRFGLPKGVSGDMKYWQDIKITRDELEKVLRRNADVEMDQEPQAEAPKAEGSKVQDLLDRLPGLTDEELDAVALAVSQEHDRRATATAVAASMPGDKKPVRGIMSLLRGQ